MYGLYAIGLVLIYKGAGVIHFGHAEIGTFALFLCQILVMKHGMPYGLAALIMLAAAGGMALVFERAVVWPLRSQPRLTVAVASIALLTTLLALEAKLFGPSSRNLDNPFGTSATQVAGVVISKAQIVSLLVVLVAAGALAAFLRWTDFGLAMVAASEDQEAVRFLGIRLSAVSMVTWGLAGVLSGLAALLIQPTVGVVSTGVFGLIFIKSLGAALIGGLSSMSGAFAGGLVVGVGEALIRHATLTSPLNGLPELCIFLAVVAVLVVRPQGLLGAKWG
jgi:branched-chain amino acid transport system permease protein